MPETTLKINAEDHASPAIEGVTGSIIKAEVVLQLLKDAVNLVIESGKKAIEEWGKQEQALTALKVVAGKNTESLNEFAESLQRTIGIDETATLGVEKLGLQMGISQENIKEATKNAIGLSTAFGIDLNQAMKMVSQEQNGNYMMLQRYIPAIKNATNEADKHAIAQNAMAIGYKQAQEKADTFLGVLNANKLASDDAYKSFGKIIEIVSKDWIKSFTEAEYKMVDFINSQKGIETITKVYGVLATVVQTVVSVVYIAIKEFELMASTIIAAGTAINKVVHGDIKGAVDSMATIPKQFSDLFAAGKGEFDKVMGTYSKSTDAFSKNYQKLMKEIMNSTTTLAVTTAEGISAEFKKSFSEISNAATTAFGGMQNISNQYYTNSLASATNDAAMTKKLKEDQFNANKALAVVDTIIKTAQAIVNALAMSGPPWVGLAMAGVVGAEGAIQTGLIAAQPMPAFARGGIAPGGFALVGEQGPEIVNLPSGARVNSNAQSRRMGGDIHIHGSIVANNPLEFFRQLSIQTSRQEKGRGLSS